LQEFQRKKEFHDTLAKIFYHFYDLLEQGMSGLKVIGKAVNAVHDVLSL
jgi:hypothetical protein